MLHTCTKRPANMIRCYAVTPCRRLACASTLVCNHDRMPHALQELRQLNLYNSRDQFRLYPALLEGDLRRLRRNHAAQTETYYHFDPCTSSDLVMAALNDIKPALQHIYEHRAQAAAAVAAASKAAAGAAAGAAGRGSAEKAARQGGGGGGGDLNGGRGGSKGGRGGKHGGSSQGRHFHHDDDADSEGSCLLADGSVDPEYGRLRVSFDWPANTVPLQLNDELITALAGIPGLTHLNCAFTTGSADNLGSLSELTDLRSLELTFGTSAPPPPEMSVAYTPALPLFSSRDAVDYAVSLHGLRSLVLHVHVERLPCDGFLDELKRLKARGCHVVVDIDTTYIAPSGSSSSSARDDADDEAPAADAVGDGAGADNNGGVGGDGMHV